MKMRIALSLVLVLAAGGAALADPAPSEPPVDNGIGTSPSSPDSYDLMCFAQPSPCGIWVDVDEATADARARAGAAPDMIVFVTSHTGCSDADALVREFWPGTAVLFEVEQSWRAKVANMHPPAVAPAKMEWRAPAPRPARAPLTAALDWFALIVLLSPIIQTIIGKIWTSSVKSDSRRAQILGYADTAFQVVEVLGPQLGLTGREKYLRFVQTIVDSLKAAGQPELSAQEMMQLQDLASVKSMLAKTPAPARPPLPLPAPARR